MIRSNCLVFALVLYLRRKRRGKVGYLMLRRSWSGPFPHFIYVELQGRTRPRMVSYCPLHPKQNKVMPPPVFEGFVRWGDQRRIAPTQDAPVMVVRSTPSMAALADPLMLVTGDTPVRKPAAAGADSHKE